MADRADPLGTRVFHQMICVCHQSFVKNRANNIVVTFFRRSLRCVKWVRVVCVIRVDGRGEANIPRTSRLHSDCRDQLCLSALCSRPLSTCPTRISNRYHHRLGSSLPGTCAAPTPRQPLQLQRPSPARSGVPSWIRRVQLSDKTYLQIFCVTVWSNY